MDVWTNSLSLPRRAPAGGIALGLAPLVLALVIAGCTGGGPSDRRLAARQLRQLPGGVVVGTSTSGQYLAGRFAHNRRDLTAAAGFLSRALGTDPENHGLMRHTYLVLLAAGRVDDAIKIARRLTPLKPRTLVADIGLVLADVKSGDLDSAHKRLSALPREMLTRFLRPLMRAWVLAGLGDTKAALEALSPLRKIDGLAGLHDFHAALINDLGGNTEIAEKNYQSALQSSRASTPRVVVAYGRFLGRIGRKDEARAVYLAHLKKEPESLLLKAAIKELSATVKPLSEVRDAVAGLAEAMFNVAGTLTQRNAGGDVALIYGRMALYLRPDFPPAQMLVGGVLESQGRGREAIAMYKLVSPESPLKWVALLRSAVSLGELGKTEDAIKAMRDMARQRSDWVDALIILGDVLRSKKRFPESVDAYNQAIGRLGDVEPRHWSLLYSRGIALERSKQWVRAEADFLRALKLKPDQPYVLNYLGYSWVDQGTNLARARQMIERAVALRPHDGYIVDSLGWALYRIGEFGDAVKQLERAVELRPEDPTINDHLGDVYWRVGRFNEARFQWRRALSLEPEPELISTIEVKLSDGLEAAKKENGGG